MGAVEGENYDSLLRNLTNVRDHTQLLTESHCNTVQANTMLINNAAETLEFNSIEQLDQGAGTLYTITSQLVKGGDTAKTLDMKGREAAVQLINVINTSVM